MKFHSDNWKGKVDMKNNRRYVVLIVSLLLFFTSLSLGNRITSDKEKNYFLTKKILGYKKFNELMEVKEGILLKKVKEKYDRIVVEVPPGDNYLPFYYIEENEFRGFIPTILKNISIFIEIPIEIVDSNFPEKKHINALDIGKGNPLSISYYKFEVAVIGKKEKNYVKTLEELQNKNVGIVINRDFEKIPRKENINFIPHYNLKSAIDSLKKDEIDYIVGDYIVLKSKIENMFLDNNIKTLGFIRELNNELSLTFKEEDRLLYNLFSEILAKDIINYPQFQEILFTPKIIRTNYNYLYSIIGVFLSIIGIILLFFRRNINQNEKVENLTKAMITSFEMASSYNDEDTGEHIIRVAKYSEVLAKEMKISKAIIKEISHYASLHDIGKIGISDSILKKNGKLTLDEREEMRKHSNIGYRLIKNAKLGKVAENIVRFHHEKWDGTGYPMGLKGEKIPLEARIVIVADVYDALRQKRAYKESYTHEEAVQIIASDSESFFDPRIIEIFLESHMKFDEIHNKY